MFCVFGFMHCKKLQHTLSVIGVGSDEAGRSEGWKGASPNIGSYRKLHSSHRLFGEKKNERSNFDKKWPVCTLPSKNRLRDGCQDVCSVIEAHQFLVFNL